MTSSPNPSPNPSHPVTGVELLPCPFCGAVHDIDVDRSISLYTTMKPGDGWFVRCHGCGVESCEQDTKAEAITAWNARAPLSPQEPSSEYRRGIEDAAKVAEDHSMARSAAKMAALARKARSVARDHESMAIEGIHIATAIRALAEKG